MNEILKDLYLMNKQLDKNEVDIFVADLVTNLFPMLEGSGDVIGLGAGRMGYSLRSFIMRLSHMGIRASMIGDTNVPRVNEQTVVLVNSSSGETPSILQYVNQAAAAGGKIFSTTCDDRSSIGLKSQRVITMPQIKSTQLMKSPYEQFSMLLYDYLVTRLMVSLDLNAEAVSHNHSILE